MSTGSSECADRCGLRLARKLHRLLARSAVTESRHLEAVETIMSLKSLQDSSTLCEEACDLIGFVVIDLDREAMMLRGEAAVLQQKTVALDDKETAARLAREVHGLTTRASEIIDTARLCFVIIVMSLTETTEDGVHMLARTDAVASMGWWELSRDGHFDAHDSWRAVVHRGVRLVSTARTLDDVGDMATLFAQRRRLAILADLLESSGDDFLTLDACATSLTATAVATGLVDDRDPRLLAAVAAAESESGQTILRDLVISFMIPTHVLGTRTTLLITRDVSSKVTDSYPLVAQLAHETAMAGPDWTYKNTTDDMRVACAALAGLACVLADGQDVRSGIVPFDGLVSLPFLVTPQGDGTRLAFVPSTNTWVLYRTECDDSVKPVSSAVGLRGLLVGISCLLNERARCVGGKRKR